MKKFILFLAIITLTASCANQVNSEITYETQRFAVVFDSVNHKMFGEEWKPGETMEGFTLEKYMATLNSFKSSRAAELRKFLEISDIKILKGYEKTFVFCVYSTQLGYAMCDDARCSKVERKSSVSTSEIIDSWQSELPLTSCVQR